MKTEAISEASRARAEEAKKYIAQKYNLSKLKDEQRSLNWQLFEHKVKQLNLTIEEKDQAKRNIQHQESEQLRRRREKINRRHFESLAIIGRGAFGEVRLCREKKSGRLVAIKCLRKAEMLRKNQQAHLKAERDVLAGGGEWVVSLLYSFQDHSYLYLVMDYLPGGDLMNLLILRNVLAEEEAKFYAAELVPPSLGRCWPSRASTGGTASTATSNPTTSSSTATATSSSATSASASRPRPRRRTPASSRHTTTSPVRSLVPPPPTSSSTSRGTGQGAGASWPSAQWALPTTSPPKCSNAPGTAS
jgi:hypothetical protein